MRNQKGRNPQSEMKKSLDWLHKLAPFQQSRETVERESLRLFGVTR